CSLLSSSGHSCGDCSARSSGFRSQSRSLHSVLRIPQVAGLLTCSDLPGTAWMPRERRETLFRDAFPPRITVRSRLLRFLLVELVKAFSYYIDREHWRAAFSRYPVSSCFLMHEGPEVGFVVEQVHSSLMLPGARASAGWSDRSIS